ncbi:uncharacterized protein [Pocillopora verrucosa]|uniref:uncharacterized protein n=1 Tax=Pocillopora verrucosa TaxID=203993 RepID=UPI0033423CD1
MAARNLLRAAASCRRNLAFSKTFTRNQSIFTKYRELPNSFLFNEKPLKPGERRKWEDWEEPWYRWWALILVSIPVLFYYKPETRSQRKMRLAVLLRRPETLLRMQGTLLRMQWILLRRLGGRRCS